ncbi:CRE-TTB-1 protein [Aphelenchoides avenae]|nr:CRE-TTB-1 protein [Aphelenchus avenae]
MAALLQCPNDPKAELVSDWRSGDVVCGHCGLVVAGRVVAGAQEWPTYYEAHNVMDPNWIGATKQSLEAAFEQYPTGSADRDHHFEKKRKEVDIADRHIKSAICTIYEMAERVSLPKPVRQQAVKAFTDLCECKSLRKVSADATAAACLYISCRLHKVPRTFTEVCSVSDVPKHQIARAFKRITAALQTDFDRISSDDYLPRFCGHLELSFRVLSCANHISSKVREMELLPGRQPISVAAAVIYTASEIIGTPIRLSAAAAVAGTCENTVRSLHSSLLAHKTVITPKMYLKKKSAAV